MCPRGGAWRLLAGLLLVLAQAQSARATFWTVSSFFVETLTVEKLIDSCTTSCRSYTYTTTMKVADTATPSASPFSTSAYTYSASDVTVVYVYLPAGSVPERDLVTTSADTPTPSNVYMDYAIELTMTAPASCPTAFTVVTNIEVYIPYMVTKDIKPTSTATSVYTSYNGGLYTYLTEFVAPSAVPQSVGNPTSNHYYSYYVKSCRNPTATGAAYYGPGYSDGSGSSSNSGDDGDSGLRSGGDDDDEDWTVCSVLTGCTGLKTWIIVVASVIPGIFVLGFLESWLWFRQLMLGKTALRFGTICWCFLSLWVICFTRRSPARPVEDQALLKQQWATISGGKRIKLWFKWGFRHRYPVDLLGPDPSGGYGGQPPYPGQPPYGASTAASDAAQAPPGAQQPQYIYQQPYPGQQIYPGPGYPPQSYAPQGYPPQGYPPPQGFQQQFASAPPAAPPTSPAPQNPGLGQASTFAPSPTNSPSPAQPTPTHQPPTIGPPGPHPGSNQT
ncbi:hypothetical protein B0T24DRAFT_523661 [Lasiosphaeria ovina]|uniref:Uncharacterized protein n=1 Tax=Lasiosphaeria ovina TaxID=92902 RepID=A0AAE0NB45_9PEZI|nr:hypothetical protein B0T24DRAFT_523661 [Lasiosphaeria ovina]